MLFSTSVRDMMGIAINAVRTSFCTCFFLSLVPFEVFSATEWPNDTMVMTSCK